MGAQHRRPDAVPVSNVPRTVAPWTAPSGALDASLTSLFSASSGPSGTSRNSSTIAPGIASMLSPNTTSLSKDCSSAPSHASSDSEVQLPRVLSETVSSSPCESEVNGGATGLLGSKRRRLESGNDIEAAYMQRLAGEVARYEDIPQGSAPSATDDNAMGPRGWVGENIDAPRHKSLSRLEERATDESDKSTRTVFLGNVSIDAIKSKHARKALLSHVLSGIASGAPHLRDKDVPVKIESLRFRSTAFAAGVGPKRAAYAKRELMEETTHSTNAYVVFTTEEAAEEAAKSLNGTLVLGRHLRSDLVAGPVQVNHRRCVFVGNLAFVDEEIDQSKPGRGGEESRKRAKQAADVEEGLWQTFSKAGKVESVRVVRDKATRVGKGIAYVQFYDENSVEAALYYNEKKFPPLLPRKLRVTRARRPKNIKRDAFQYQVGSREQKRTHRGQEANGTRSMFARNDKKQGQLKNKGHHVFEGHRAQHPSTHSAAARNQRLKRGPKPRTRSSRRGAVFKAARGKKIK